MKKDIHKKIRPVVFYDASAKAEFLIQSCVSTDKTTVYKKDGKEYPLYNLDVSSASHPIYTGKDRIATKEGRVSKFKNKFGHEFSI
jgi:large subunit ribosomal protein L31